MDSGVGGLSIVTHIREACPTYPLLYLADNAAFPYGDKDETWLVKRVVRLALALVARYPVQLLVLGCNTASTVVLPALRDALNIPVVGVVPAIKPAAALSQNRHIGLLATPGTVSRAYTDQLIDDYAAHCAITRLGSTEVVRLAEEKLAGRPVDLMRLQQAVSPLFDQPLLDTVVLGCTHFPLLRQELQLIQPRPIQWVDSGAAVARRVAMLLKAGEQTPVASSLSNQTSSNPVPLEAADNIAFVTAAVPEDSELAYSFARQGFGTLACFEPPACFDPPGLL